MSGSEHNRRRFLSLLSAAASPWLLRKVGGSLSYTAEEKVLRIGIVASSGNPTPDEQHLLNGIQLGVDEARQTAAMFGYAVHAEQIRESSLDLLASPRASTSVVAALVGGVSVDTCLAIGGAAAQMGALYLNAGCSADSLRREHCRRSTFHVCSSDAMRSAASRLITSQTGAISGDARIQDPHDVPNIQDWHADLERFGAGQLSDRYRARFPGIEMDALAWSGWMAVKVLVESLLRTGKTDATSLASFLESDRARFDGHKGAPLSFRQWDHQLRQPVYDVQPPRPPATSSRITEFPDGRAYEGDVISLLDELGDTKQSTTCHWER